MKRTLTPVSLFAMLLLLLCNSGTALSQLRVEGCGDNSFGQLGIGSKSQLNANLVQPRYLGNVRAVAATDSQSIAVKWDGTVWQWGQEHDLVPRRVIGLNHI